MKEAIKKGLVFWVSLIFLIPSYGISATNGQSLIAHYYIVSNNSIVGTLAAGEFSALDYEDYGQQQPKTQLRASVTNEPFGWQQEYRDAEMNLTYLRARYYQPDFKSFLTMDSYPLDNKYAYAHANPTNFADPSGHLPFAVNYALNGFALVFGLAMMVPTGGASFVWDATTIAGTAGVTASVTGLGAQALSDTGLTAAGDTLSWISQGLGWAALVMDMTAGVSNFITEGNNTSKKVATVVKNEVGTTPDIPEHLQRFDALFQKHSELANGFDSEISTVVNQNKLELSQNIVEAQQSFNHEFSVLKYNYQRLMSGDEVEMALENKSTVNESYNGLLEKLGYLNDSRLSLLSNSTYFP